MTVWYEDPVTVDFNPPSETGRDFGTPFHTPVGPLLGGKVIAAGNHPWGEEVDIAVTGGPPGVTTEYIRHLDTLNVKVGDIVKPNQLVGLSGGELVNQLGPGVGSHPVTNPQYSSGPHIEYGLMGPAGQPINPASVLAAADPNAQVSSGGTGGGGGFDWTSFLQGLSGPAGIIPGAVTGATAGGSLQLINIPDMGKSFTQGMTDNAHAVEGWFTGPLWSALTGNIVPLLVAVAILVVIFGNGSNSSSAPAPQVKVMPVPV
jgi:hypothetical protein